MLILGLLCVLAISANGQSIIRQSIGTSGTSSTINGVSFYSSVGQTFSTTSVQGSSLVYRPGFVQPISVKTTTSSKRLSLDVYPNPASKQINVSSASSLTGVKVVVLDLQGRTILEETRSEVQELTLDCSMWSKGTYIIKVQDASNKVHISKIVVNN